MLQIYLAQRKSPLDFSKGPLSRGILGATLDNFIIAMIYCCSNYLINQCTNKTALTLHERAQ